MKTKRLIATILLLVSFGTTASAGNLERDAITSSTHGVKYGIEEYFTAPYGSTSLPEWLSENITHLDITGVEGNAHVIVTGAVFDGETIIVTYLMENTGTEYLQIELDTARCNGEQITFNNADGVLGQDVLLPRPVGLIDAHQPIIPLPDSMMCGSFNGYSRERLLDDVVEIEIDFVISKPMGPLVIVSDFLYETPEDEWAAERLAETLPLVEASGLPLASENELDIAEWVEKGYVPISTSGTVTEESEGTYYSTLRCYRPALMEEIDHITVSFRLPRITEKEYYAAEGSYQYGDWFVSMNQITRTPIMMYYDMEIAQVSQESTIQPYFLFSGVDEDGMVIPSLKMGWSGDSGNTHYDYEDDSHVATAYIVQPGINAEPSSLAISNTFLMYNGEQNAATLAERGEITIIPLRKIDAIVQDEAILSAYNALVEETGVTDNLDDLSTLVEFYEDDVAKEWRISFEGFASGVLDENELVSVRIDAGTGEVIGIYTNEDGVG